MRWVSNTRLFGLVLVLFGCAEASGLDAWSRFEQYRQELSRPVEERRHDLFVSRSLLEMITAADSSEEKALRAQVEFPLWFSQIMSRHHVDVNAQRTCLTLSGLLADGSTFGTVSVEYVRDEGELMVNDLYYQYLDGLEEFPGEARCPGDIQLTFPS